MEAGNPFSQMQSTQESIVAQVRQQLSRDYPEGLNALGDLLDRSVESVVHDLWQGRVKTFVPVLALREARELLRDQRLTIPASQPEIPHPSLGMPLDPPARDAMRLDHDIMTLDVDDVLRL